MQDLAAILPAAVAAMTRELSALSAAGKGKSLAPGDVRKALKPPLSLLPLVLHGVTSPSVRAAAMGAATVRALAECISLSEAQVAPIAFTGSVEFRRVLHLVIEALAQQQALVVAQHEAVISHLLPALVQAALRDDAASSSSSSSAPPAPNSGVDASPGGAGAGGGGGGAGSTRYLCLRSLGQILGALMAEKAKVLKSQHTMILQSRCVRALIFENPPLFWRRRLSTTRRPCQGPGTTAWSTRLLARK
jgi:hypothetical protein